MSEDNKTYTIQYPECSEDKSEYYVHTQTGNIEWHSSDLIIVDDLDLNLTKGSKSQLARYLDMSPKLIKGLSDGGENHDRFKEIFSRIASIQNLDIVIKVNEETAEDSRTAEAFIHPNAAGILNSDISNGLIPALNVRDNFELRYKYVDSRDAYALFEIKGKEPAPINFCGKEWRGGVLITNSSVGEYALNVVPALIPSESMSFYSLPFGIEPITYYPENMAEALSDQFIVQATGLAEWCAKGAEVWAKRMDNELSIKEYVNVMKAIAPLQDLVAEEKMLFRLGLIYDAHGLNPDDGKPTARWEQSAQSGTTLLQLMKVGLDIDLDTSDENSPVYAISNLLDGEFNLNGLADNVAAADGFADLAWE